MEKKTIFTVNLYDYLNDPNANSERCREYQDHNKKIIDKSEKFEYKLVDIDDDLQRLVDNSMLGYLPKKYYYQMISDLVRYKELISNPGSIFIDTDFCIFNDLGLDLLYEYTRISDSYGIDLLGGEINKNRLFPCNWLMVGSSLGTPAIKDMYQLLLDRLDTKFYDSYKSSGKWKDKIEDYIWTQLWGYAIPSSISMKKFSIIPYEYWQASEWNKDWRDANVMKPSHLVGCHFFGFGEGGRPKLDEFLIYHKLK